MSETFDTITKLVAVADVRVSEHGYDQLADDDIRIRDVLAGVARGTVIEDYPEFPKAPRFWCYNSMRRAFLYILCGGFREAIRGRL